MKNKIIVGVIVLVVFVVGFFAGMEYKSYQIRTAIQDAFSGTPSPSENKTAVEQAKEEKMTTIEKKIGDELVMATGNLKINRAEEKQSISASYGSPKVAKAGTKFVVVSLDVTNTTKSSFSFSPDDVFKLVDNQDREFETYSDSIGGIENYLNYRELAPSVKETGVLVYEIPSDATGYSLITAKQGTKELYKITLK